jgi:hypothetical protein
MGNQISIVAMWGGPHFRMLRPKGVRVVGKGSEMIGDRSDSVKEGAKSCDSEAIGVAEK